MSAGTFRKQYEALAEFATSLGISFTTPDGSFNEKFCDLCRIIIIGLGGTFTPVQGTFTVRKAVYLRQVAIALGITTTEAGTSFRETFLKAAFSIWNDVNDGTAPDNGSSFDWRVYQYLNHAIGGPSGLNPLQYLYLEQNPEVIDKTSNALDADYVDANCTTWFGGGDYIEVSDLVGTESVVSSEGTSVPSVNVGGGRIDFTAGTCWNLILDSGHHFLLMEGAGTDFYNIGTGADGVAKSVTESTLWGTRQSDNAANAKRGFRRTYYSQISSRSSFVILGDSLTNQNGDGWEGGSSPNTRGYFNWMRGYMSNAVSLLSNEGVGGETTTGILARVGDVTSQSPDFCVVLAGVNDVFQDVAIATIKSNINAIDSELKAAGVVPIWLTTPRGTEAFYGASPEVRKDLQDEVNAHILTLDNSIDITTALEKTDESRTVKDGAVVDSIHWSERGAEVVGRIASSGVDSLVAQALHYFFGKDEAPNIHSNPEFDAAASGWSVTRCTKQVVTEDNKDKLLLTSTADDDFYSFYINNISDGKYAAGDTVQLMVDVEWDVTDLKDEVEFSQPIIWFWFRNADGSFDTQVQAMFLATADRRAGLDVYTNGRGIFYTPVVTVGANVDRIYTYVGWDEGRIGDTVKIHNITAFNTVPAEDQSQYPYIPALNGSIAADGNELTNLPCGEDRIWNNFEGSIQQKAANTEFLTNPFWSADGINYDKKGTADFLSHKNFDNNVVINRPNSWSIKEILTWDITKNWTPSEYIRMVNWLAAQGSVQENLVPYEVASGGIGPSGTWLEGSPDGTIILINP